MHYTARQSGPPAAALGKIANGSDFWACSTKMGEHPWGQKQNWLEVESKLSSGYFSIEPLNNISFLRHLKWQLATWFAILFHIYFAFLGAVAAQDYWEWGGNDHKGLYMSCKLVKNVKLHGTVASRCDRSASTLQLMSNIIQKAVYPSSRLTSI